LALLVLDAEVAVALLEHVELNLQRFLPLQDLQLLQPLRATASLVVLVVLELSGVESLQVLEGFSELIDVVRRDPVFKSLRAQVIEGTVLLIE